MKTITETVKVFLHLSKYEEDGYDIYMTDMTEYGDVLVTTKEFEMSFDVPEDFNANTAKVESLKLKKQKIGADAQVQMNNIEEQIQSLLAIECDS